MSEVYLKQIEKLFKLISKPSDWFGISLGILVVSILSLLNIIPFNWQSIFACLIGCLSLVKAIHKSLFRNRLKRKAKKLQKHIFSLSNGALLLILWETEINLFVDKITSPKDFEKKIDKFANEYKKLAMQENSLGFTKHHYRLIENTKRANMEPSND